MIRIGIIGVGTIGIELAHRCVKDFKDDVKLVGIVDTDKAKERKVRKELNLSKKFSLHELIDSSDLIIEAASAKAAYHVSKEALSQGRDVMLMSAGGILRNSSKIFKIARKHRSCLYLPSGAVTGIDALKSARVGKIKSVSLITRKAPIGFKNAPYIVKKRIALERIKKETILFEGSAYEAVVGFPQNINISATLSLAGIGDKKTKVKIIASPGLKVHIHEVLVDGQFGCFYTRTENKPAEENPKTSRMAILSAVATLKRILGYVKVGT